MCSLQIKLHYNELDKEDDHPTVWKALQEVPAAVALIVYVFLSVWFVGGLSIFHAYLISTNQTTYENFRFNLDKEQNPYNEGIVKNCCQTLCSFIPRSRVSLRAKAFLEGSSTPYFGAPPHINTVSPSEAAAAMSLQQGEGNPEAQAMVARAFTPSVSLQNSPAVSFKQMKESMPKNFLNELEENGEPSVVAKDKERKRSSILKPVEPSASTPDDLNDIGIVIQPEGPADLNSNDDSIAKQL
eukprot:CAMPEP_0196599686 /NCGR_PEP_ID=MMETSP1081-20130531/94988_1 /TAXON_ID=36882 /ORGANISM="Pyramimonas amylifera, Strain CCMP720" /LENGTH=241 /DNA_ID=CAMNT_0041925471 /DNA_START=638 /DNA_END=1363 /DNA_ORIENTATION=+